MVGIRRYIVATLAVLLCSISSIVEQSTLGSFAERQRHQLSLRAEQVQAQLQSAREAYMALPSDSLARVIHQLEKQSLAIGSTLEKLAATIEAERVAAEQAKATAEPQQTEDVTLPTPEPTPEIEHEITPEPAIEPTDEPEPEAVVEPTTEVAAQPEREPVSEELKKLFITSMRRYKLIEDEIAQLFQTYEVQYDSAKLSRREYDKATSLQALNGHYENYLASWKRCGTIADKIVERSDMLFASKTKSLLGFADTLSLTTLAANYAASVEEMEHKAIENLSGNCIDTDLAIYPMKLQKTVELEREIATYLVPEEVANIEQHLASIDTTLALYSPIDAPKRSDAKFAPVKVNSRAKHKAVSSLPLLKIPSSGELYSITVANYASLPQSTSVFRNATPLYRERREDGRTYIYVGLYPTANSAQDDIAYLKKIGFKEPTLVMWRDGIRRDDFVDRNATATKPRAAMFRVEILTSAPALSAEVLDVIKAKAPRKERSKFTSDGTTTFTIGIFTKEAEAKSLANAIAEVDRSITTKVVQIGN